MARRLRLFAMHFWSFHASNRYAHVAIASCFALLASCCCSMLFIIHARWRSTAGVAADGRLSVHIPLDFRSVITQSNEGGGGSSDGNGGICRKNEPVNRWFLGCFSFIQYKHLIFILVFLCELPDYYLIFKDFAPPRNAYSVPTCAFRGGFLYLAASSAHRVWFKNFVRIFLFWFCFFCFHSPVFVSPVAACRLYSSQS